MEKQEMKQVMEMLKTMLASMDANQARMEAEDKAWREEMEARRNVWRKETIAYQEKMMARMNAGHKEMMAWLKDLKINGEETMTCQEKMEVRLEEEPTSVEMKPVAAHEEVPLEDAEVMPVGEPRKRRRD
jgi:hypothetical protein